ncbi:MAG: hypothetical protein OXN25_20995 [Candidatus Poribacteria bacterium]|nr:hypothetical protein [Candidatus Poribacteria bacterium]
MMKDTNFLFSMTTLALGSIIVIFVSYATNTLPKHSPRKITHPIETARVIKNCSCCAEITPQALADIREHWEVYKKANELLQQHGREEGLRRLKQIAPTVAAQLEKLIEKKPVTQEP